VTRVRVCATGELPPGEVTRVEVDGLPIAVVNLEGTFYALADTCSHEEASLSLGEIDDDCIECPKHGAQFHIPTGEARSLPATKPVATFAIEVADGDVFVEA